MNHRARSPVVHLVLAMTPWIVSAAITTAQAQLEGPGSELVGWWRFEETSGAIAYDSSGNGHNGTLINSPTRVAGKIGTGALSFDGISALVKIPASTDFDFSGDFSVSAWVYSKTNSRVTAVGRAMGNLWQLWVIEQITDTRFDMEVVRADHDAPDTNRIAYRALGSGLGYTTNAWYHAVGVKTGDRVKIYVDGTPGTDSAAMIGNNPTITGVDIAIGSRRAMVPDANWNGYIDDVRVYNRALSGSEILMLSDGTPPSVTAFSVPSTSSSLAVLITNFTAGDNVGVTGYIVTESSTAPLSTDPGWTATSPPSYTFSSTGSKTLYAWVKDAAGNVSAGVDASVTVAIDTARPEFRGVHTTDGKCVATFDAIAGKTYVLEQSFTLVGGWSDLQTIGPVADSGPITVEVAITTAGASFFRLRVEP